MKIAVVLSCLLLLALVQESDAGWIRRVVRRVKSRVGSTVGRVRDGVKKVGGAVRDAVRGAVNRGVDRASDRVKDVVGALLRGKRSALTLNHLDDVNAVDIGTTFELDELSVRRMFIASDTNKNGSLDGREMLTFLKMIEAFASLQGRKLSFTF